MDGPAEQTPQPADVVAFGHYRVRRLPDGSLDELGRGAMGVTYRAFDPGLRKQVAIKVIASAYVHDESTRRRFQREARAAAQLTHPHVAGVLHLGEQGGEFFYAMEFVAGRPLSDLLRDERVLSPVLTLALLGQVAAALAAAHKRELIHRDLKPANLMLLEGEAIDHDDERIAAAGGRQVKVVDFGLARSFGTSRLEDSLATQSTHASAFTGTPAYASPEQCAGATDLDGRSDLYSLGIILWQCLTGKLPFVGTPSQVLGMQQFQPPPVAQLAGQPVALVQLLTGLLAKNPEERRPATASELRETCDRLRRRLNAAGEETVGRPDDETQLPDVSSGSVLGLGATAHDQPAFRPRPRAGQDIPRARRKPVSPLVSMSLVVLLGLLAVAALWFISDRILPPPEPGAAAIPGVATSKPGGSRPAAATTPAATVRRYGIEALTALSRIENQATKVLALRYVAEGLELANFTEEELVTLKHARETTWLVTDTADRVFLLRLLARVLRPGGDDAIPRELLVEARTVAKDGLSERGQRDFAYKEIAAEQMKLGDARESLETLQLITSGVTQDLAKGEVAAVLARRDVAGAIRLTQEITNVHWRGSALGTVIAALAGAGELPAARQVLAELPAEASREAPTESLWLAGVKEYARALNLSAARTAEAEIRDASRKAVARGEIALAMARAGDSRAGTMFASARAALDGTTAYFQVVGMCDVALLQAEAGDTDGARLTLMAARQVALPLADASQRNSALNRLGITQARIGDSIAAEITLEELKDANWRTTVLAAIVAAQCKAGAFDAAREFAKKAPSRRLQRAHPLFVCASMQCWTQGAAAVEKWAAALTDPTDRAMALAALQHVTARQLRGQKKFDDADVSLR